MRKGSNVLIRPPSPKEVYDVNGSLRLCYVSLDNTLTTQNMQDSAGDSKKGQVNCG